MLGLTPHREALDDLERGRVDHVDGVALGVGNVDQVAEVLDLGTELTGAIRGVHVVGLEQRRHPGKD